MTGSRCRGVGGDRPRGRRRPPAASTPAPRGSGPRRPSTTSRRRARRRAPRSASSVAHVSVTSGRPRRAQDDHRPRRRASTTDPAATRCPARGQIGVELDRPVARPLAARDGPGQVGLAGVEQDEEAVVDDPAAKGVRRRDGVAVEEHADGAGEAVLPVVLAHRVPVGRNQARSSMSRMRRPWNHRRRRNTGCCAADRQPSAQLLEVLVDVVPVEPGDLVVLAVGVVVAALGAAELVAAEQHRHALGEQQRRHQVAPLAGAQGEDVGIVGLPLDAAVPRAVVATRRRGSPRRWPRCACRCRRRGRAA